MQERVNLRKEKAGLAASAAQAVDIAETFKEQLKDALKLVEALERQLEEKDAVLHDLKDTNSQTAQNMHGLLRDHKRTVSDMCADHARTQVSRAPSYVSTRERNQKRVNQIAPSVVQQGRDAPTKL